MLQTSTALKELDAIEVPLDENNTDALKELDAIEVPLDENNTDALKELDAIEVPLDENVQQPQPVSKEPSIDPTITKVEPKVEPVSEAYYTSPIGMESTILGDVPIYEDPEKNQQTASDIAKGFGAYIPEDKPKPLLKKITEEELKVDNEFLSDMNTIYKYEKGRNFGEDIVKPKEEKVDDPYARFRRKDPFITDIQENIAQKDVETYGDIAQWGLNRQSKLNFNITNALATGLDISNMPDDVKKSYVRSIAKYATTQDNLNQLGRAMKEITINDPLFWGTIFSTYGIGALLKLGGQKALGQITRNKILASLQQQTGKKFTETQVKNAVTKGGTKAIPQAAIKKAEETAIKELSPITNFAKKAAVPAELALEGGVEEFVFDAAQQFKNIGFGLDAELYNESVEKVFDNPEFKSQYNELINQGKTPEEIRSLVEKLVMNDPQMNKKDFDFVQSLKSAGLGAIFSMGLGLPLRNLGKGKPKLNTDDVNKVVQDVIDGKLPEDTVVRVGELDVPAKKLGIDDTPSIPKSDSTTITTTVVKEEDELGNVKPKLKERISETIGKWNTRLDTLLGNTAGMNKEMAEAVKKFQQALKESGGEALSVNVKALKKLQEGKVLTGTGLNQRWVSKEGAEKFTDNEINQVLNEELLGLAPTMRAMPQELKDQINKIVNIVRENEAVINDGLGLTGDNRLGMSWKNGDVYFTRNYEASLDPDYYANVSEVLRTEKGKPEFVEKVNNAIKALMEGRVDEKKYTKLEAKEKIDQTINYISNPETRGMIFNSANTTGRQTDKVLKKRKPLGKDMVELFGLITDPSAKVSKTLENQERLIATLNFIREVEGLARNRIDPVTGDGIINLGGFFKWLPVATSRVSTKAPLGKLDEVINLKDMDKLYGNKFGGNFNIIQDMFVSKQLADYIASGGDLIIPGFNKNPGGGFAGLIMKGFNALRGISGAVQMSQTIYDWGAYIVNTVGAALPLFTNGYVVSPAVFKSPKAFKMLFNQVAKNDEAKAIYLDKLKADRVVDQELNIASLEANADLMAAAGKGIIGTTGKGYKWILKRASKLYAAPDTLSKIIGHMSEYRALRKIYPELTDDEVFAEASKRVRTVMPTYGEAAPLARLFAQTPLIGNYLLFPSEVIRNAGGTIYTGLADIAIGYQRKNAGQIFYGLKRLVAAGSTAYAMTEGARMWNNWKEGGNTNEDTRRGVNLVTPDWSVNKVWMEHVDPTRTKSDGTPLYHRGLVQTKRNGPVIGRYKNMAQLDAQDAIKTPLAKTIAWVRQRGGLSNKERIEVDRELEGAWKGLAGSYFNPRQFLGELIAQAVDKDSRTGRPIFEDAAGNSVRDKLVTSAKRLGELIAPGTFKDGFFDWFTAAEAEKALKTRGEGQVNGRRMSVEDVKEWWKTGVRPTTLNLNDAIGYSLSRDLKSINKLKNVFNQYINDLNIKTDDQVPDIIEKFIELTDRQRKAEDDLRTKIKLIGNISYTPYGSSTTKKLSDNPQLILQMANKKDLYRLDERIALMAILKDNSKKFFNPVDYLDNDIIKSKLESKGINYQDFRKKFLSEFHNQRRRRD
tara:strand:+ start:1915 stop:6597 length:4683 start_codon:yes stop_codon:yes gene_type:complete